MSPNKEVGVCLKGESQTKPERNKDAEELR